MTMLKGLDLGLGDHADLWLW